MNIAAKERAGKDSKPLRILYPVQHINLIVVIVGWLTLLIGLFGIVRPHGFIDMVLGMSSSTRFYLAVVFRIVVGILFLLAARRCRVAWFVYVIGVFVLLTGVVLLFLGSGRVDEIVNWFAARSDSGLRLAYVVDVIFGVLLVYTGSKRR